MPCDDCEIELNLSDKIINKEYRKGSLITLFAVQDVFAHGLEVFYPEDVSVGGEQ